MFAFLIAVVTLFLALTGTAIIDPRPRPSAAAMSTSGYIVNEHAASPAETRLLASFGAPPGNWVVDGYGISRAVEQTAVHTDGSPGKCYYVLDVFLCD